MFQLFQPFQCERTTIYVGPMSEAPAIAICPKGVISASCAKQKPAAVTAGICGAPLEASWGNQLPPAPKWQPQAKGLWKSIGKHGRKMQKHGVVQSHNAYFISFYVNEVWQASKSMLDKMCFKTVLLAALHRFHGGKMSNTRSSLHSQRFKSSKFIRGTSNSSNDGGWTTCGFTSKWASDDTSDYDSYDHSLQ